VKISSAQLAMTSTHQKSVSYQVNESLRTWVGERRPDFEKMSRRSSAPSATITLSEVSKAAAEKQTQAAAQSKEASDALEESGGDAKTLLMKFLIEAITGHRVKLLTAGDVQNAPQPSIEGGADPRAQERGQNSPQRAGWGVEYDRRESYDETETTTFASSGVIKTADGKEINFNLSVAMNRSYHQQSSVSVRAGDAVVKDPLVLNFAGTAAELQSTRVGFDLNSDGQSEAVPLLGSGSAYLALDLDHDGQISSGKELFGPTSGDGYAELAAYDSDGNQFIDENDAVYGDLRLWTPAAQGGGELVTLRDRDVGAIALTHTSTPFELRSADNQSLGAVRSTGVYLSEDGAAGTVQQIDLTV
jgi:hypothetical protein